METIEIELEAEGIASAAELADARRRASEGGVSLPEALAELRGRDERALYELVARVSGRPLASLDAVFARLDPNVVRSVPVEYQRRKRLVPIAREHAVLQVVSCDPAPRVLDLADALDCERAELLLVTPSELRRILRACELGRLQAASASALDSASHFEEAADLIDQPLEAEGRHVGLLDALLVDAVGERASDLHIERYGQAVRVRLRVDGDLHDVEHYRVRPQDAPGIVNVLKIRARLDIAERRRPQGGRFAARIGGRDFDLRLQTLPSLHGEGAVVRFLPQDRERFELGGLGFSSALEHDFRRALARPSGLVLVVGPTGSGKTTTLYAGLQEIAADPRRKVITIEDPIEYAIDGIHQSQVAEAIDFRFAGAVRAFVRHDPDVIFVGEIRDEETALEAARASQTGHLVLSTLHSNDAVDAIQRLADLGLHPNSIAAELRGVFAQRLVRRICPACRERVEPDRERLAEIFPKGVPRDFRAARGRGCDRCRGRGTFGRIGVAESLVSTRDLRLAIAHRRPLDELRAIAGAVGLRPLRAHALDLVRDGTVSLEDLMSVLPIELLRGED